MTTYYRTTDGALIELTPEQIGQLAPNKRDTLKAYSVDAEPTLSDTQFVAPGPVVVDLESLASDLVGRLVHHNPGAPGA